MPETRHITVLHRGLPSGHRIAWLRRCEEPFPEDFGSGEAQDMTEARHITVFRRALPSGIVPRIASGAPSGATIESMVVTISSRGTMMEMAGHFHRGTSKSSGVLDLPGRG